MSHSFSNTRAMFFALAGFSLWTFSDASLKFLTQTSLPKYEIVMLMSVSAIATMFVITLMRGKLRMLRSQKPHRLFIIGVFLLANTFMLLVAFKYLPLTGLYAVTFMGPMLTAVLASLFMHERLTWRQKVSIVTGFVGVLTAINVTGLLTAPGEALGYVAAFLSLALNTGNMLLLRIYGKTESHESMAFYPRFIALAGGLLGCVFVHFEPVEFKNILPILTAGFFAGAGWLCVTVAGQKAPASLVAPFRYSQIVTGACLGYLVWHDVPTLNLVAGVMVIVFSGLYFTHHMRQTPFLVIEPES